ncbi:MAG TPA: HAD-IA family hydrolase [Candidatus Dormibacteraeota bacterium]
MGSTVVFWDFEGTLASRSGIWSQCLVDVLDKVLPGHGLTRGDFAPALRDRFPWHDWRRPHPELSDPDAWWAALEPVLAGACLAVGLGAAEAERVAAAVRTCYVDPAYWSVYPDVRPALEDLRAAGWRHAIVSNHVPELPELVRRLGIADLFDVVLTSATTGYEKPHPRMYLAAREAMGRPRAVWMVGDNPLADVEGAEASAIPAILLRSPSANGWRRAADAFAAARIILESAPAALR